MKNAAWSWRFSCFGALALLLACSPVARADLAVTVENAFIEPGTTGFVDVSISGAGDLLALYGLEFNISDFGLSFVPTQDQSYLNNQNPPGVTTLPVPDYVFYPNSSDFYTSQPALQYLDPFTVAGGDVVTGPGGDVATGVPVPVSSSKLLARLEVAADADVPMGKTFTISLVPHNGFSYYQNSLDGDPIDFAPAEGTVTVVPEASPLVAWISGGMSLALLVCWRRRCVRASAA